MPKKKERKIPTKKASQKVVSKRSLPKSSSKKTKKRISFLATIRGLSFRTKALFIVGILLLIAPITFYANETIQLAFFTPTVPIIAKKYPVPTRVTISAINLDLPIQEEAINRGAWGIADDAISHLNTSARPREDGPIILYGHNTNDRFGPIRWLSKGQEITLTTAEGKTHVYKIVKTEDASPNQVNLLNNVTKETLILYTCDGFADLQRFLVFATPEN